MSNMTIIKQEKKINLPFQKIKSLHIEYKPAKTKSSSNASVKNLSNKNMTHQYIYIKYLHINQTQYIPQSDQQSLQLN